jgi:hypothetical protein
MVKYGMGMKNGVRHGIYSLTVWILTVSSQGKICSIRLPVFVNTFVIRLRKIFELSETVASRTFLKRAMPDELINDEASVVLVGGAAHPLVVRLLLLLLLFGHL